METVQQNGRFTLFYTSKFHSNIYSILFGMDSTRSKIFPAKKRLTAYIVGVRKGA